MAVSKRLRYEVLRRDGHTCKYCGQSAPDVKLTVDHVMPSALGGSDDPSNLVAACVDCNSGKSASSPDASVISDVDQRAVQWAQAMQVAVERRAVELDAERGRTDAFDLAWRDWNAGGQEIPRDPTWRRSILRFLGAGLDDQFLAEAVDIAMRSKHIKAKETWRYFCGICWREIDKLQKGALNVLNAASPRRPESGSVADVWLPSRPDSFDYMRVFDAFLDGLVPALGGSEEVRTFVDRVLWEEMEEAEKVWRESLDLPRPDHLEDDEEDCSAVDAAREHLADSIAPAMYEITQWRYNGGRPTLPETAPPRQRWDAIMGGYNSYLLTVGKIATLVGIDGSAAMRGTVEFSLDVEKKFAELCESRPYKGQDADRGLLLTAFRAAYPGDDEWTVLREVSADGAE